MKILLISPLLTPFRKPGIYNIGLGYIASVLIENGHNVEILDIEGYRYIKTKVLSIIKKTNCDIIGIGTLITGYRYLKWLTKEIKKIKPNVPIILGNSVGTTIPEIAINNLSIDIIVIGEGEVTILEVVDALEQKKDLSNIQGICFKKNGQIIRTPNRELIKDIDTLPMPAWNLFPQEIYMNKYKNSSLEKRLPPPIGVISTSRGCPFHCTYCYHPFQYQKVRYHSAERVIEEIKALKQNYNIKSFMFADDLSIVSAKRIFKICDLLEKEKLNLKWIVSGRVDLITEELLRKMKNAGCQVISFGIESGSQKILDNIKKQVTVLKAKKAILLCNKIGIYPGTSFMIGNVGETRETVLESVSFITKYIAEPVFFFITTPYPETELFNYAEERGLIKDKIKLFENYGEQGSQIHVNFTEMSDEELWALKHEAENIILKNYFKQHPLKIISHLKGRFIGIIKGLVMEIKKNNFKKTYKKFKEKIDFSNIKKIVNTFLRK